MDAYNQHLDGYTCNWDDTDSPKESKKHFEYMNDLTTEYTEVLQIYSNNFKPFETFVYGNQKISHEDRKGNLFLYQYDSKGSVIGQKNNIKSDELLYKISYNYFGMPNRELDNEYGYNAEVHDYNGTQYLRARYYDTKTETFGQRDTFLGDKEEPQSLNRYTYVWNNPNKYVDPSGHWNDQPTLEGNGGGTWNPWPGWREKVNRHHINYNITYRCSEWILSQKFYNDALFKKPARETYNRLKNDPPTRCNPGGREQDPNYNEGKHGSYQENEDYWGAQARAERERQEKARKEQVKKDIETAKKELIGFGANFHEYIDGITDIDEILRILRMLVKICKEIADEDGKVDNDKLKEKVDSLIVLSEENVTHNNNENNRIMNALTSPTGLALFNAVLGAVGVILDILSVPFFPNFISLVTIVLSFVAKAIFTTLEILKFIGNVFMQVVSIVAEIGLTIYTGGSSFVQSAIAFVVLKDHYKNKFYKGLLTIVSTVTELADFFSWIHDNFKSLKKIEKLVKLVIQIFELS